MIFLEFVFLDALCSSYVNGQLGLSITEIIILFLLLLSIVFRSYSRQEFRDISEWIVVLPIAASIVLVAFMLRESSVSEILKGVKIANNTMRLIIFTERISNVVKQFKVQRKAAYFMNCGPLLESNEIISPVSIA